MILKLEISAMKKQNIGNTGKIETSDNGTIFHILEKLAMHSNIYLNNIGNIGKTETSNNRAIFHRLDILTMK